MDVIKSYLERSNDDVDVGSEKSSAQSSNCTPKRVIVNATIFRRWQGIHIAKEKGRSGNQNTSTQRQKDVADVKQSAFLLMMNNECRRVLLYIGNIFNSSELTLRKIRAKIATKTGTLKMMTEASANGI